MEAKDSEEKHDSFAGSNSEAEVSSASSNDKPIVILVIGDSATSFVPYTPAQRIEYAMRV